MIHHVSTLAWILVPFICDVNTPNLQVHGDGLGDFYASLTDAVRPKLLSVNSNKTKAAGLTDYQRNLQNYDTVRYTNASELNIIGKIQHKGKIFHRLDTAEFSLLPENVKKLATQSAGLAISFRTNSSRILAKWCTSPSATASNMTGIAFEGMDLYILKDKRWQFAGVARPDSPNCTSGLIVENLPSGFKDCLLFLPTYDETTSLEIGVDFKAQIRSLKNPFHANILIYGSSIVQGASASRPGLAYPARLSRNTGYQFINFGFSGNGKMEPEVAKMIAAMPADAFILDCVPNPSPKEILERTKNLILTIRKKYPLAPIIAIQSVAREKGNFDMKIAAKIKLKEEYFAQEIRSLQLHDSALFLIDAKGLLGDDQEGTADGIHPNDLGFDRMIQQLQPQILAILNQYGI